MKTRTFRKVMVVAGGAAIALAAFGGRRGATGDQHPALPFRPGQVEVAKGTTVTWTSQDDITHTVTSGTPDKGDGRLNAPLAGKGATTTVEFKELRDPFIPSGILAVLGNLIKRANAGLPRPSEADPLRLRSNYSSRTLDAPFTEAPNEDCNRGQGRFRQDDDRGHARARTGCPRIARGRAR